MLPKTVVSTSTSDPIGITRAAIWLRCQDPPKQGTSTITQQLALLI
ncbi:hypothetical protein O9993_20310 [Vibrio lentus]|nr:hypothetical protein [Vibrio lentus]